MSNRMPFLPDGFTPDAKKTINPPKFGGGIVNPSLIVFHFTPRADDNESVGIAPDGYVAAHFAIGRDGTLYQSVPINRLGYHATGAEWNGKGDVNSISIGVEFHNWGPLIRRADGRAYAWPMGYQRVPVPDADVVEGQHKNGGTFTLWERYRDVQIATAVSLVASLRVVWPTLIHVVGHDDLSTERMDPGPAFPWQQFRDLTAKEL